MVHETEETHEW